MRIVVPSSLSAAGIDRVSARPGFCIGAVISSCDGSAYAGDPLSSVPAMSLRATGSYWFGNALRHRGLPIGHHRRVVTSHPASVTRNDALGSQRSFDGVAPTDRSQSGAEVERCVSGTALLATERTPLLTPSAKRSRHVAGLRVIRTTDHIQPRVPGRCSEGQFSTFAARSERRRSASSLPVLRCRLSSASDQAAAPWHDRLAHVVRARPASKAG